MSDALTPVNAAQAYRLADWPTGEFRVLATDIWGGRWLHPARLAWADAAALAGKVAKKREILPGHWEAWPYPKFGTAVDKRRVAEPPAAPWAFVCGPLE